MGGELQIDSAPGKGARIQITLPFEAQLIGESSPSAEIPPDPPKDQEGAFSPSDIRVMVVDDHATLRDGIISMLSRQPGIRVIGEAATGDEAIDGARRHTPDVILMDINMPGMNGIEATRRIKEEMPHVRIIGLSMHDDPEMIQSMHDAGASDFVSKGKPLKQLIEVIHRVQTGTNF